MIPVSTCIRARHTDTYGCWLTTDIWHGWMNRPARLTTYTNPSEMSTTTTRERRGRRSCRIWACWSMRRNMIGRWREYLLLLPMSWDIYMYGLVNGWLYVSTDPFRMMGNRTSPSITTSWSRGAIHRGMMCRGCFRSAISVRFAQC